MPSIRAGSGDDLRRAAESHALSAVRSDRAERAAVLVALRSTTRATDETPREAQTSFDLLLAHLADVPIDVLKAGCRAYANVPGTRFFPKSAGEIRAFTDPIVFRHKRRAARLRLMAAEADVLDAEAARMSEVVEIPLEEIRGWKSSTRAAALEKGWITQAQVDAACA